MMFKLADKFSKKYATELQFPGLYKSRQEALKMLNWIISSSNVNIGKNSARKIKTFIEQLANPKTNKNSLIAPTSYDISQVAGNIVLYRENGNSLSDNQLEQNISNLLYAMKDYSNNYFSYIDPVLTINTWKNIIKKIQNNDPIELDYQTIFDIKKIVQPEQRIAKR